MVAESFCDADHHFGIIGVVQFAIRGNLHQRLTVAKELIDHVGSHPFNGAPHGISNALAEKAAEKPIGDRWGWHRDVPDSADFTMWCQFLADFFETAERQPLKSSSNRPASEFAVARDANLWHA